MIVICSFCASEFDKLTAEVKRTKNNFCSKKCAGSYSAKVSAESFYDNTKIVGDCMEWAGAIDKHGYGAKRFAGRTQKAHRVSYVLSIGDIGDKMVLHSCDNRKCVNPAHLFAGSHGDNMNDMARKGRKRSVFTFEQVQDIKSSSMSVSELACFYGESYATIMYALNNDRWLA